MKVIDVFEGYYAAACVANARPRHAVKVCLTATGEEGRIRYEWLISFFPHDDPEDFAVSYDAALSRTVFEGKGRRSKKRDTRLLEERVAVCDSLAQELGGTIYWDKPLREVRMG